MSPRKPFGFRGLLFEIKIKFFYNRTQKQLIFRKKCDILHKQITKRPYGQAVKTTPSHGVNSGSSPDKVTILAVFDRFFYQKPLFFVVTHLKILRFWGSFGEEFLLFYQLSNFFPSCNKYSSDKSVYAFPSAPKLCPANSFKAFSATFSSLHLE